MNGTERWDRNRGVIRTAKGGWKIGKGVTSHGYSLFDDLVGHASFFQVLILNVRGGRLPEKRLADWLEATFILLSWPDPRLWPNFIGALAGTVRTSPLAGVCAGTLAADSMIYGPETALQVVPFLRNVLRLRREGARWKDIVKAKKSKDGGDIYAPGFVRPMMRGDERVPYMQAYADRLGFGIGPHLETAYRLDNYLRKKYDEGINLSGYINAFLLDQEFSVEEIYLTYSLCVNGGVHACFGEAAAKPPTEFLPMQCIDVDYEGAKPREVY